MTSVVHYKSPITSTGNSRSKVEKFGQAQGIEKQQTELLPVSCYHLSRATNHAINPLILLNQKVIADVLPLAWVSSETLKRFDSIPGRISVSLLHDSFSGQGITPLCYRAVEAITLVEVVSEQSCKCESEY